MFLSNESEDSFLAYKKKDFRAAVGRWRCGARALLRFSVLRNDGASFSERNRAVGRSVGRAAEEGHAGAFRFRNSVSRASARSTEVSLYRGRVAVTGVQGSRVWLTRELGVQGISPFLLRGPTR